MKVADLAAHDPAVTGVFADDTAARTAIERLRALGVRSGSMAVARDMVGGPPSDTPAMSRVFWTGFWWSVAGAVLGIGVGLLVGLLGVGVPGTPDNVWIQVASWGMFAHVAGAIIGCYLALDTGDRFSTGAAHHDLAATLVRVRLEGETDAAQLEAMLRDAGARDTQRSGGAAGQAEV